MGSNHLRVLRSLHDVDVVGLVDRDPARLDAAARGDAAARRFDDVEAALSALTPDFVCVATPAPQLARTARVVIAAGVPILVEKPLAPDATDAQALVREAEAAGVLLAVGHVERFNPAVSALKQKLDDGAIGRIYQLHARRLSPRPNRDTSLGVALDLATHDLDVMRYLTGSEVQRVYAETAQRTEGGSEDLVCGSLRFDDETTGVLEVNWLTPTKVRELTVTGEGGMFVVDYLTQDLRFYERPRAAIEWEALGVMRGSDEGDMVRYAIARREPLAVQWDSFLNVLRGGGMPAVTGDDGVAALSIAQALQEAGRTHRPVRPSYRT